MNQMPVNFAPRSNPMNPAEAAYLEALIQSQLPALNAQSQGGAATFNVSQLQQLQASLGMLINTPVLAANILGPHQSALESPPPVAAAPPSAFNPFLFPQSMPPPGPLSASSSQANSGDTLMDNDPLRSRHHRNPEKRREQNRQASQRARLRARQREEQVVGLQHQLQHMISEMSTIKQQLDDANKRVESSKKVEQWRETNYSPNKHNERNLHTL